MGPFLGFLDAIKSITSVLSLIAFLAVVAAFIFRDLLNREQIPEVLAAKIDRRTINLIIILSFASLWLLIGVSIIPKIVPIPVPTKADTPSEGQAGASESEVPTEVALSSTAIDTPEPSATPTSCTEYPLGIGATIQVGGLISTSNIRNISKLADWSYSDSRDAEYIRYSQNSEILIIGLTDGTIRLVDAITGDLIIELPKHQLRLSDLDVQSSNTNGFQLFGTSSIDSSMNVWLLAGEKTSILKTIKLDSNAVTTLTFSPLKGDLVATGDVQNRAHIWSIPAARYYDLRDSENWIDDQTQEEGRFFVSDSTFSLDGQLLAVSSTDGTIQVFNVLRDLGASRSTLEMKREIQPSPISPINLVLFSPIDRVRLYAASNHGNLSIYNAATGELLGTGVSAGPLVDIAISNDGSIISGVARTDESTIVHVWDEFGTELRILELLSHGYSVSISPDGKFLAVSDRDGIYIWGIEVTCEAG